MYYPKLTFAYAMLTVSVKVPPADRWIKHVIPGIFGLRLLSVKDPGSRFLQAKCKVFTPTAPCWRCLPASLPNTGLGLEFQAFGHCLPIMLGGGIQYILQYV